MKRRPFDPTAINGFLHRKTRFTRTVRVNHANTHTDDQIDMFAMGVGELVDTPEDITADWDVVARKREAINERQGRTELKIRRRR